MKHTSIHWFRKGLRLHDNPALLAAMTDCRKLYPIFILDPWFPKNMRVSVNRWRFLVESLRDLDESLRKLNSRLFVVRGRPTEIFPGLFKEWKVTRLTFEVDTEPYSRQRDREVVRLAAERGVQVIQKVSNTLYDTDRVIAENNGKVPLTYVRLQTLLVALGPPKQPVPAPALENLKGVCHLAMWVEQTGSLRNWLKPTQIKRGSRVISAGGGDERTVALPGDKGLSRARVGMKRGLLKKLAALPRLGPDKGCCTPCKDDHDAEYGIPMLEELGQDPEQAGPRLYPGGESEALCRLDLHMNRTAWVCNFQKPQTEPNSLSPSTTVLSPYIKFGCLSVRTFWWRLAEIYQGRKHSSPPVSLHGQLLWREFFYTAGAGIPNFDKMEGNPVCVQVDWDDNPEHLRAWSEGRTGYPFIDAIMTQLRTEGWIHHLARHAVACFLTRGDLWISWEQGQKVFEELLLDADWSLNAGNWQWLSASAFFHQFFRVYSPVAFGKKTDKGGEYIKKYLPLLRKFPAEHIYEPWRAPRSVQEQAGCVIGRDYPKPIVAHEVVSKRNVERMKAAYARRLASTTAQPEGGGGKKGAKRKPLAGPSVAELLTKKPD